MKEYTTPSAEPKEKCSSPASFFRDIEIEFLIHELKDPISIIETGMRTLLEKRGKYGPLSARQEKTLKRSLRNTRKIREMLNGLLEIGRSEAGRFVCRRFQPVETVYAVLIEILETTADHVSEEFTSHAIREDKQTIHAFLLNHGICLEIAPQVKTTELLQDETKFRQIFGNLIKNAIHHCKERITIRMNREQEYLCIDVSDDGPGVKPEHHQTIFQRYTQIKTNPTVSRKGHGLGLAGALILAQCLGGDIELHSTTGKGATFRLILPITLKQETVSSKQ